MLETAERELKEVKQTLSATSIQKEYLERKLQNVAVATQIMKDETKKVCKKISSNFTDGR